MISACILTKNSERTLSATLQTLSGFPEIILYDTGSTDRTLEIARSFLNVRILQGVLDGFGPTRNRLTQEASHDWILALDSDERLSEELQQELRLFQGDPRCVYEIDFRNYYRGKWIKGCGWHPERHVRLYNRTSTSFSNVYVHESVLTKELRTVRLKHPIHHTPYLSVSDFLAKMQHYSDLFAKEHSQKRPSSVRKAVVHGVGAFLKSYLLKRGLWMGQEGLMISLYNANTAFYKYMKLAEINALRSSLPSR